MQGVKYKRIKSLFFQEGQDTVNHASSNVWLRLNDRYQRVNVPPETEIDRQTNTHTHTHRSLALK